MALVLTHTFRKCVLWPTRISIFNSHNNLVRFCPFWKGSERLRGIPKVTQLVGDESGIRAQCFSHSTACHIESPNPLFGSLPLGPSWTPANAGFPESKVCDRATLLFPGTRLGPHTSPVWLTSSVSAFFLSTCPASRKHPQTPLKTRARSCALTQNGHRPGRAQTCLLPLLTGQPHNLLPDRPLKNEGAPSPNTRMTGKTVIALGRLGGTTLWRVNLNSFS